MALNRGKQFELKFKECWLKSFPNSFLYRLNDQMSGYKVSSSNICDFIAFNLNKLYLLEIKSHEGNTFPINNLTQYTKLVGKVGIPGVRVGVIIWFIDHDRVIYVPISTITQLINDGKKSVNINKIEAEGYRIINIPSIKKRVFLDSDYSILMTLEDFD